MFKVIYIPLHAFYSRSKQSGLRFNQTKYQQFKDKIEAILKQNNQSLDPNCEAILLADCDSLGNQVFIEKLTYSLSTPTLATTLCDRYITLNNGTRLHVKTLIAFPSGPSTSMIPYHIDLSNGDPSPTREPFVALHNQLLYHPQPYIPGLNYFCMQPLTPSTTHHPAAESDSTLTPPSSSSDLSSNDGGEESLLAAPPPRSASPSSSQYSWDTIEEKESLDQYIAEQLIKTKQPSRASADQGMTTIETKLCKPIIPGLPPST